MRIPVNPAKRLRTAIVTLAFLVTGAPCQEAGPGDALTQADRRLFADGLFSRGLHTRAAAEYEALVADFPGMDEVDLVLFRWAEALRLAGRSEEAGRVLLRIFRDHPKSPLWHRAMFQRGAIAITQDHFEAAAELLGALLDEQPVAELRESALYYRSEALAQLGHASEAIAEYERFLGEFPGSALADYGRLSLGRLLAARGGEGDDARARALFLEVSREPATERLGGEALYLLAQCEFTQGRFQASADAFLELGRRYPEDHRTLSSGLQAAWASHQAGLHAETLALASRALERAEPGQRAEWLYLKGTSEHQLTRYAEAIATFGELAIRHPDSRYAGASAYQAAIAHQRLGDPAKAVESALLVSAGDPLRRDVLWLLAECHATLRDVDRAVQYYRLLADEFPESERAPEALYRLAHQLQDRDAWMDASEAYLRMVARFGTHSLAPRALFASGYCLMRAGRSAQAIRDWDALIQSHPQHEIIHEARFRKALEEIRMERWDEALLSLDGMLRLHPQSVHLVEARFWRSKLLHRKGDVAEAEKEIRTVLGSNPPKDLEREATFLLGLVVQQAGRDGDAAELFQSLLDDPLSARFTPHQLAWLSEHQYQRGAYPQAESAARKLVAQAPDDGWRQAAWTLVGRSARQRADLSAAEAAYRSAIEVPGETRYVAEAHLRLGEICLEKGGLAEAEELFRAAARLAAAPDLQAIRILAHAGLGRALRQRGDADSAARYLLGICLLYRDDLLLPPLIEETVVLLRSLDREEEAKVLLQDLQELYPRSDAARRLASEPLPEPTPIP